MLESAFGYLSEKKMWLLNSSEMLLFSLGEWLNPSPPGRERGRTEAFSSWSQSEASGWSNKAIWLLSTSPHACASRSALAHQGKLPKSASLTLLAALPRAV